MASVARCELTEADEWLGLCLPITLRPPAALSDEELIAFSRRNRPYRIEQNAKGELEIMSPVGGEGSEIEAEVIFELGRWTKEHGGHFFSSNGGFRLADSSVLSPDAAWISDARWDLLTKEQRRTFPPLCPEFLIEIRSESDSRLVLEEKMILWIANGAQLAWMIDPQVATVSIYRPGHPVELLDRPESVEAGEPVGGFRLAMHQLWQR